MSLPCIKKSTFFFQLRATETKSSDKWRNLSNRKLDTMPSREENRKAAKELLARCAEQGVKVPTNPVNAVVEAGTMLNATREKGEFCLDAALEEMIKKFGVKEPLSPTEEKKTTKKKKRDDGVRSEKTTATRGKKRKSDDVEDEAEEDEIVEKKTAKKPRKAEATCEANQK
uniref:Uncharacterized protein n=1 Tax=Hyaloperonospora arabidopsidis (strain Emoy2) TaxID=559515 RepID=M4C6X1_HYAAE